MTERFDLEGLSRELQVFSRVLGGFNMDLRNASRTLVVEGCELEIVTFPLASYWPCKSNVNQCVCSPVISNEINDLCT